MNAGRQVRKPLAETAEILARALSARPARQRPEWLEDVRLALAELIAGLRRHITRAEAPRGLFATLLSPHRETVPTLDRRVEALRRELTCLMDQAESLYLRVRTAAPHYPDHEARSLVRAARAYLHELDKHLEVETKLLLDSLNTVVGVGD